MAYPRRQGFGLSGFDHAFRRRDSHGKAPLRESQVLDVERDEVTSAKRPGVPENAADAKGGKREAMRDESRADRYGGFDAHQARVSHSSVNARRMSPLSV